MKLIWKLLFGQIRLHPTRFLLTTLAVIASAGVVIWVVSGYEALVSQFDDFSEQYLGRYQLVIAPAVAGVGTSPPKHAIPQALLKEISQDRGVRELDFQSHSSIFLEKVTAGGEVARGPAGGGRGGPGGGRGGGGRRGASAGEAAPPAAKPETGDAQPTTAAAKPAEGTPAANAEPTGRGPQGAGGPAGAGGGRGRGGPGGGRRGFIPPQSPILVGTAAIHPPYTMVDGRWIDGSKTDEAAISRGSAQAFDLKVGDTVKIRNNRNEATVLELRIVGIVGQAGRGEQTFGASTPDPTRGPAMNALYVPMTISEKLDGSTDAASIAQILLTDETQPSEFRARWAEKLASAKPSLVFLTAEDVESDLQEGRSASSARNQAYSATGIALLAALFIIFTALSMGVNERARQFAVLRAVSLTPRQIGLLIAMESLLLGLVGWLGGLAAGWGLLKYMEWSQPALFPEGVTLGAWCIGLSAACAFGGSLAAAVLPAWRAMRISPLEAMSASGAPIPTRSIGWLTAAGLLLILINPLLVFAAPMQDESRYPIYVALGCSTMAIGFVLLAPGVVQLVELLLGPIIARLLRLNPRLVANELSSNLWRTVGTCVALTLGLGLYVSTQIWGYSMLQPFVPGPWVPDILVNFRTGGIPDDDLASVINVKGLRPETVLPLAVEQPLLVEDLTGSAGRRSVSKQDNVIMIGMDPDRGIAGKDPVMKLRFVQGNPASAAEKMKTARGCLVPDHFARETGLKVGDKFSVIPPESSEKTVEYTIAGVIELPGWHWMTKMSGLRRRHGRAGAMVFADYKTVKQDYELPKTNFFWAQLAPGAVQEDIGNAMKAIADKYPAPPAPVQFQGTWTFGAFDYGKGVRISTPDEIRQRIRGRADTMIWGMSQLPLVTLLIAGVGVLNTVMASIRARVWNIGVMRAVGLTRFSLARLILAESLLTAFVACGLSLAFGIMAGWCGAGISQYVSFFGGLNPSLVIPWPQLLWGIGATLLLCLIAALGPAIRVSRMELLSLLQAGRSSM